MRGRQYNRDILAPENRKPKPGRGPVPQVEAERDLVVEDFEGRFCGAVVATEPGSVTLEDRFGKRRVFPLPGTFLIDGKRVTLVRPSPKPGSAGSVGAAHRVRVRRRAAAAGQGRPGQPDLRRGQARRRAGRADLGRRPARRRGGRGVPGGRGRPGRHRRRLRARARGGGSACWSTTWSPGPRRAGSPPPSPATRTCWWSGTRSSTSGRRSSRSGSAWPPGPTCRAACRGRRACWPGSAGGTRPRRTSPPAWRRIRGAVTSYADLEPELLGRVEELIDFVTAVEGD